MVRDRIDSDDLPMTQEFLSVMLGVRRSGVSAVASTLRAGGLIQLSRGHVTIIDHDAPRATAIGLSSRAGGGFWVGLRMAGVVTLLALLPALGATGNPGGILSNS